LASLIVLAVAPWLRDGWGFPGPLASLLMAPGLSLLGALLALARLPGEQEVLLAADHWSGAAGGIASAYEIQRTAPESPFAVPLHRRARAAAQRPVPPPRHLGWWLAALVLMLAALPVSRHLYAEAVATPRAVVELAEVRPEEAQSVAEDAAQVAEEAAELNAPVLERLAADIARSARNAATRPPAEPALREANALLDRLRARQDTSDRLAQTRADLAAREATRPLAESLAAMDLRALDLAAARLSESILEGDQSAYEDARRAAEVAMRTAGSDEHQARAAQRLSELLKEMSPSAREALRGQRLSEMAERGLRPEQMEAALKALEVMDKELLKKALEEFARAASALRDLDLSGLDLADLSPEELRGALERAAELLQRLQLDAETLRDMLRQGRDFPGLQDAAMRMAGQGAQGMPQWAMEILGLAPAQGNDGGHVPNRPGERSSPVPREGEPDDADRVYVADTGDGDTQPGRREQLDTDGAQGEQARRVDTGRRLEGAGADAYDPVESLPRRYREAARRYFER
jgi:hypothetical protein